MLQRNEYQAYNIKHIIIYSIPYSSGSLHWKPTGNAKEWTLFTFSTSA